MYQPLSSSPPQWNGSGRVFYIKNVFIPSELVALLGRPALWASIMPLGSILSSITLWHHEADHTPRPLSNLHLGSHSLSHQPDQIATTLTTRFIPSWPHKSLPRLHRSWSHKRLITSCLPLVSLSKPLPHITAGFSQFVAGVQSNISSVELGRNLVITFFYCSCQDHSHVGSIHSNHISSIF